MNNATNKTNEEAADLLEKHLDFFAGTTQWVFTLAIAALRSTPPATGAAAMREDLLAVCREGIVAGASRSSGTPNTIARFLVDKYLAIRPLPAPEVAEAVRLEIPICVRIWCEQVEMRGTNTFADRMLRDWLRERYQS